MVNSFGRVLRFSTWGESHRPAIETAARVAAGAATVALVPPDHKLLDRTQCGERR